MEIIVTGKRYRDWGAFSNAVEYHRENVRTFPDTIDSETPPPPPRAGT
jgi:predicted sulfurtransferase